MKTGMSKLFKGAALLALLGCSLNGLGAARAEAGVETGIGTAGATAGAAASTTNNIANFNADKNVVQAGGWSYLYAPVTGAPSLLNKGDGTKFAADEWAQDIKNANHVWFVKANGQIGTDYKPIAFNYTASAAQAGKTVKVHGTYAATDSGHFQVLLSKDADAGAVAGPYDTLFDYTGAGTSFDLNVTLQAGYDLMFVSRDHKYWWEPSKLDATIDTLQAQPVTADPPPGIVKPGTLVTLATPSVGAAVYYTLDKSDPLVSDTRLAYASPISVTTDTYITAVATKDDLLPSEPVTFSYKAAPSGGSGNPTTNNVADYNLKTNALKAGGWSYLYLPGSGSPSLLQKGDGTKFAADEWALDLKNANHVWFVKANGQVGTDDKPIAFNYTAGDDQDGKTLRLQGNFSANGSGHFRILLSKDTDPGAVKGPFETLFEYTGAKKDYKLRTTVQKGNDLLFVTDHPTYWWEPSKVDATVVTEIMQQTAAVTATPDSGSYAAGTKPTVTLASGTEGATVYYTTDGSDPLASSTKIAYTQPFVINGDTVVTAAAVKEGMEPSDATVFKYVAKTPFRNFNGINQGPDQDLIGNMAWNRFDFLWGSIEPAKGQINENALNELKSRVLEAKKNGITIVPVLAYTADWAANRTGYSYEFHGLTYEVGPVLSEQNHKFTREVTTKDAAGNVLDKTTQDFAIGNTPPQHAEDWENYVKLVVSIFGAAPYNLQYYQVWNEAYPGSGFWWGGMDQYMDLIHLPAAKVIQQAGKKVVYGGWICGAPINEFIDLLDRKRAWKSVDVFDMHYMPLEAMDRMYDAAKKRGIDHPYIWQTELGFSINDKFVADTYPRAFYWALTHQAKNNSDQFKLFYFANWAPNDPNAYGYNRSLHSGGELSVKGKTLTTLFGLLNGNQVKPYSSFDTSPELKPELNENLSSAEGFLVDDKRVVVAVHMKNQGDADIFVDWNGKGDTMHLGWASSAITASFKGIGKDWTVKRVDLFGNETQLNWEGGKNGKGTTQVTVPVPDTNADAKAVNATGNETIFYIVAEAPTTGGH